MSLPDWVYQVPDWLWKTGSPLYAVVRSAGIVPSPKEAVELFLGDITDKIEGGTATPEDLDNFMVFSPFILKDVDQELVMFGAAATGLYLSKTERGMKLLDTMVKQYFGTMSDIVSSVAKGGSTHVLSSLTAQMTIVRMMRRLGLISNDEANTIHHELSWTINKIIMRDMVKDLSHAAGTVFGGIGKALAAGA